MISFFKSPSWSRADLSWGQCVTYGFESSSRKFANRWTRCEWLCLAWYDPGSIQLCWVWAISLSAWRILNLSMLKNLASCQLDLWLWTLVGFCDCPVYHFANLQLVVSAGARCAQVWCQICCRIPVRWWYHGNYRSVVLSVLRLGWLFSPPAVSTVRSLDCRDSICKCYYPLRHIVVTSTIVYNNRECLVSHHDWIQR